MCEYRGRILGRIRNILGAITVSFSSGSMTLLPALTIRAYLLVLVYIPLLRPIVLPFFSHSLSIFDGLV